MKIPVPDDKPHHFGPITYQFSDAEVLCSDCERFLDIVDTSRHNNFARAKGYVGSIIIKIGVSDAFKATADKHPVCIPEFQKFARELMTAFPALPLFLDYDRDECLSDLLLANLPSLVVTRNDKTPDKILFSFKKEEYARAVSAFADAIRKYGREINLTDSYINSIRVKLWNHLHDSKDKGSRSKRL